MSKRVLVLQTDRKPAEALGIFFSKRGYQVWYTASAANACELVKRHQPDLAFLDLHTPDDGWQTVLECVRRERPKSGVIATNKHPDVRLEMRAREQGIHVFLREPFSPQWVEKALEQLQPGRPAARTPTSPSSLPLVKVPIRLKITVPFALLALLFAIAATYLGSRFVVESIRERFTNQLVDAATLSADWMVQEETRILDTLRLLANTQGLPEAIAARDAEVLRQDVLPIAINYREETILILDLHGASLLSLRHRPGDSTEVYDVSQGDPTPAGWVSVQRVLGGQVDQRGDKFAELVMAPWGEAFYIAGPVYDEQGSLVGVVLVGKSLETLARQMRQDTLAQVTFYDLQGISLASTVLIREDIPPLASELLAGVLKKQDQESLIRDLKIASASYSEILGPWEARGGEDLGIIGVSLVQNFFIRPTVITRFQAFFVVALAFVGVIAIGLLLARQVTTPLAAVVQASTRVAQGNLEVKVPPKGNDEVAVLAHAFNYMISGLQEGFIYRDLLGRTVSPEIRETLRRSFASGDLRLEGQTTISTVLMSDIRGFTTLSEKQEPTTILNWLNEYFGELVPIITAHGGVVDKFEGDAMLAFFGILPTPVPSQESAYQACRAAVEMIAVIERINARRARRGEPVLITGIAINTGPLTAGGLGTSDRLNYTIIGNTVNTTQRMQAISREFGESGVVISEYTLAALKERRGQFRLEPLGQHAFKGKQDLLWLHRLWRAEAPQPAYMVARASHD